MGRRDFPKARVRVAAAFKDTSVAGYAALLLALAFVAALTTGML